MKPNGDAIAPNRMVVTTEQMQAIETRLFDAGMPVAALMEKVAGKIAARIARDYPQSRYRGVGVLIGPGHNGGDALVVARELYFLGYEIVVFQPFAKAKELTTAHANYLRSLGVAFHTTIDPLQTCDLAIDGLFGFGLTREISGDLAAAIAQLETFSIPTVSIDLPSGIHTDTGAILGTAVRASQTLCLGLWKRAFLQDCALDYLGTVDRLDFDIPVADIAAIVTAKPLLRHMMPDIARQLLPLKRSPTTYKYAQGNLLVVAGSERYAGSVLLTALGARATGIGMLTVAAPAALKPLLVARLPEALIVTCPETPSGAIAQLPADLDLGRFDAVVCGPGLSVEAEAAIRSVLAAEVPLVLDADGLNLVAQHPETIAQRSAPTVLTPHLGEFRRLFPEIDPQDRITAARAAAVASGAVLLLKGARTLIAEPETQDIWGIPESTPGLARGGSGDVLAGVIGGLVAQAPGCDGNRLAATTAAAAWWHAQAGILAARDRTVMGVDPATVAAYLTAVLAEFDPKAPARQP